ncbi:MAG: GFA family protein [Rhodospirillaceae bacterium]|jgi:hypothetical protein|nr:GFA family protein [Rhodospirillaceae bacterium]MBT4044032.1 GFA family protein [Rhodospirillaceae bacterium]MBT4689324.1 GFA family protein [Rhodospirillaceae bacterium]MBT5084025.1 GFA family protein [Rhodospirillaceae bacterium]MBT5523935.1 GFA family protein [Rhodospirillaceae bacterium]
MSESKTGGCLCGAVRYELTAEPITTMICSCTICQHSSGSALSTIALVARDALKVEGELKGYEYAGDSGNKLEINFCPNCGSPVLLNMRNKPDIVSIKVGSFDDTSWFKPKVNIWADSAQTWMPEIPDCMVVGRNPG